MRPGDVFVLNAPYNGGTHLPDVTVIAPVFLDDATRARCDARPEFYVGVARPPRRHRRHHARLDAARLDARRRGGRAARQRAAGRATAASSTRRCARSSNPGRYPVRNVEQNLADLRAQVAACAKGARRAREDGRRTSACRSCARTCSTCRTTPRRRCAASSVRCPTATSNTRWTAARCIRVAITRRSRSALGDDRLHRHERAAADEFQRAVGRLQGGGAVRVPHARRRRDSDECRLPEAADDRHPGRLDAEPALSGGRRRGQRRDVADGHRRAVRRARRARRIAGHDEQLHVRQRDAPVLRDDLRAAPARVRISTARASCRRT